MRHLALPFYWAVIVALLLAMLARAIYTGADSFVLLALGGIAYFGWHGWQDARRCWPAFRVEMHRRTARRRAMPADDTH